MAQQRLDLFELLHLAVTVTDPGSGRIRGANGAACVLLGRSESELIDTRLSDVALPENSRLWFEEGRSSDPDSTGRRLVRLLRPDHSVVHAIVSSAQVPGPTGEPELLSQLQDVSDEIAANDRLRIILDNTPVAVFLVNRDGVVLASKGLMEPLMERIVRQPDASVFTLFADLPDALAPMRAALAGQRGHQIIRVLDRQYDLHLVPILGADHEVSYVTCVATDVTEHQRVLAALRTRSAEQTLIADLGQHALESLDAGSLWQQAARMLAVHLGADIVRIHELDDAGQCRRTLATATDGGASVPSVAPREETGSRTLTVTTSRGTHPLAAVEVDRQPSAPPLTDQDAQFIRSVGTVLGAAAMRFRMEEEIRWQSLRDGLTGLPNRTALLDRLDRALHRARVDERRIGVLFIDLDGFKAVNDTLGHRAGDQLLQATATRLEHAVRPGDLVSRLAGDEFAVLCERINAPTDLEAIADRVLAQLDAPCLLGEETVALSASVGLALSESTTHNGEDLLNAADIAMYTAKRRGPGRRLAFDETMRTRLMAQLTQRGDLLRAMDAGELVMRYQPVRTAGDDVVGAAAMPHWRSPDRGLVPPAGFLPSPGQPGQPTLRVPLDRWTIGRACRAAGRWRPIGAARPLLIAPVSGRCLAEPRFLPELAQLLADTGGPARYQLCLEIATAEIVGDERAMLARSNGLQRQGVVLCAGEFGTRAPVASTMTALPFAFVRIGGVYLTGVDLDPVRRAGTSSIVHFAHELGVRTIAGDVTTDAQLAALRALRCDLAFGPAVGRATARLPQLGRPRSPRPRRAGAGTKHRGKQGKQR